MTDRRSEAAFETVLEHHLLQHGYTRIAADGFDRERALFPDIVLAFIRDTQPRDWARIEALLGDKTGEQVLSDLRTWMDREGPLATFRHGFKCYGRTLRIAFFRAAHELNPELAARYARNTLGITRQLHYSQRSNASVDVTLSLNGVPIATLELKNPLTGQTVEDARAQYMRDRDPGEPLFAFKRRTLVHFAVDTEAVLMTTRLAKDATHFLPFNKGDGGAAGNPPDPYGRTYRTAYLWEDVLERRSLLDLLAHFLHLQIDEKRDEEGRKVKVESLIFPRYHQLTAVRELVDSARAEGPGHNYLIEHSAGSGKSNTIAWLAHRLASLHDDGNQRVFDCVIVVTDRVVLDQQLQDTIYQLEHRRGVVEKIDESSRQLAEALERAVPIIITTLQKFSFVTQQLLKLAEDRGEAGTGTLPTRRCAVIIDEAHSSQGGETATVLKEVLGGETLRTEARRRAAEEGREDHEELFRSMAKRGRQANLSFFAFTATPKHKTLAVFGRGGQPAHRYTMRQAIEEGFILDVLRSYTTYATYHRLLKACEDDPNVERKKAARALARFVRLHPHNIAQKTEVIVEHFQAVTRHRIGGRAKAMVVTGSRLEAVKYKLSFDRYIQEKGYPIKSLVAFSGEVQDDQIPDLTHTEEGMNGIREKELPERFATSDYQVLLVAEKYQTGFDQPLLHTMFVDKRLAGIQAVQTLSRLNRIHPNKEDTFVLDFVNDRQEIQQAFKDYYEGAVMGEEVDPARMYALKGELDGSGVYREEEITRFCDIYFKPKQRQSHHDHQAMNAALDPAVSRFKVRREESPEEAELWRGKVQALLNLYSFLSQVIPYQDSDLERLHVFLRYLSAKLPRRAGGASYQFSDEVRLEYYRLQKISEGSISLRDGAARPLDGPAEVGSGLVHEQPVRLSQLIDVLNGRFATDFNQADQLFFDQIVEAALKDDGLKRAAVVNSSDKFRLLFRNLLERLFIDRMEENEEIFVRYMNDPSFQGIVTEWMAEQAYRRLRQGSTQAPLPVEYALEFRGLPADADAPPPRPAPPGRRRIELLPDVPRAERYRSAVPIYDLQAVCGEPGAPQRPAPEGWVRIETGRKLNRDLFVARCVGRSMEPEVPDGSYGLFRLFPDETAPSAAALTGRRVVVQFQDLQDPETGARYTLKRWRVARMGPEGAEAVDLVPENPEFPVLHLMLTRDDVRVVAELLEVLAQPEGGERAMEQTKTIRASSDSGGTVTVSGGVARQRPLTRWVALLRRSAPTTGRRREWLASQRQTFASDLIERLGRRYQLIGADAALGGGQHAAEPGAGQLLVSRLVGVGALVCVTREPIEELLRGDEEVVAVLHGDDEVAMIPDAGSTEVAEPESWHLDAVGALSAYRRRLTGSGVWIGVADTGVDPTHREFAGRDIPFAEIGHELGLPIECDNLGQPIRITPGDPLGHGTSVAGLAVGANVGIAPSASLAVAQITKERTIRLLPALGGIEWLSTVERPDGEAGVDIINLSWGFPGYTSQLRQVLGVGLPPGILVIAAIGNEGPGLYSSPASYACVVGAGALDQEGHPWIRCGGGVVQEEGGILKPDYYAPGVNVCTGVIHGGYARRSGTSMASPIVAGVAALIREERGQTADLRAELRRRALRIETSTGPGYCVRF